MSLNFLDTAKQHKSCGTSHLESSNSCLGNLQALQNIKKRWGASMPRNLNTSQQREGENKSNFLQSNIHLKTSCKQVNSLALVRVAFLPLLKIHVLAQSISGKHTAQHHYFCGLQVVLFISTSCRTRHRTRCIQLSLSPEQHRPQNSTDTSSTLTANCDGFRATLDSALSKSKSMPCPTLSVTRTVLHKAHHKHLLHLH